MSLDPAAEELCKVCGHPCEPYDNPAVRCEDECQRQVHVRCLRRGALPSNLIGDVFYDLYCADCSETGEEMLERQKLSWLTTLVLTLYNLREKSYGTSRRGYFHWKSDVSVFISNNWETLFTKTVKKKKNWIGTISGTLSHYSNEFFHSGTADLGEQGWWKLKHKDPPEVLITNYNKLLELRKQHQPKGKAKSVNNQRSETNGLYDNKLKDKTAFLETQNLKSVNIDSLDMKIENINSNEISICDQFEDSLDMDIDVSNIDDDDISSFKLIENTIVDGLPFFEGNELHDMLDTDCFEYEEMSEDQTHSTNNFYETLSECSKTVKPEYYSEESNEQKYSDENTKSNNDFNECKEPSENNKIVELPLPLPSLFTKPSHVTSLLNEPPIQIKKDLIRPLMSERQEEYLYQKIEKYKHLLATAPPSVRRLYRKLKVRKEKRQLGIPMYNIDTFGKNLKEKVLKSKNINNVLDRYMSEDLSIYFEQRLQGPCELTPIYIPDIDRVLDPLIFSMPSCPALWLKVMNELLTKVNCKKPNWKPKPAAPVNFSYVRPQHIPAMNSLCSQFFWPGVDLTECLQYPHTTIVALYKKLVIGFGVMVPDVSFNESYISFLLVRPEWRKAGIGKFMLYHLTQTVWSKDITLHVSATNPAMILYEKFSFQKEEYLKNFYDKYIPLSSKESKDAFFLRLK